MNGHDRQADHGASTGAARDPTSLAGFDAYFHTHIEPPVRLPRGLGQGSPRANLLALGAALAGGMGITGRLLEAPAWLYGPPVLLGAGLLLGAVQLRMGGQGMSLREARDHVVATVAGFLGLDYSAETTLDEVQALLDGAAALHVSSIVQCRDQVSGTVDGVPFLSVQIAGASRPAPEDGECFGMPVALLTERYSLDGLLARIDLPVSVVRDACTVSSDRRLAFKDRDDAETVPLAAPQTGDERFDTEFRVHGTWQADMARLLTPPLRECLLAIADDVGPVTLHCRGDQAFLAVWSIGDVYELSSLGGGLRGQCETIAGALAAPARLARALAADLPG